MIGQKHRAWARMLSLDYLYNSFDICIYCKSPFLTLSALYVSWIHCIRDSSLIRTDSLLATNVLIEEAKAIENQIESFLMTASFL